jgi:hypothetical protein
MNLLQTFLSHRIQPLCQSEMTMWMYPGPRCLDRPFSTELGDTGINTRIRGVLTHGVDLMFGSSLVPLREGIDNSWVNPLGLTFIYLCQFLFLNACVFLHMILGMLATPCAGSPYLRMW